MYLRREPDDDLFEDNQASCMWGIIHALDYHYWQNSAKKKLPHKRTSGSRHTKGKGRPKAISNVQDSDAVQTFLNAEASNFLIDPSTTETSSTNKRWSLKARIKTFISEENSKQENFKKRDSRLRRTYSIHQLEPSDHDPHGKIARWSRPIIFLHGTSKSGTKKPVSSNEKFHVGGTENFSDQLEPQQLPEKCKKVKECQVNLCNEYVDVLDLFWVNKDLILKSQQQTNDGVANCLCDLQASSKQARLTKSGSFPSADFWRIRNFRPSKLKHKQTEIWSFPKGEKFYVGTHESEGSVNDLCNVKPTSIKRTSSLSGSLERYAQKFSVGTHESEISVNDPSNVKPSRIRRTSSLSESLERYAHLLQTSFSEEAKLHPSKSLKVTNEYEITSDCQAPLSFKRVRSLSLFDYSCSIQSELASDAQFSGILVNTVLDSSKNVEHHSHGKRKPLDLPASTEKYGSLEINTETERGDSSLEKEHVASLPESRKEDATANMVMLGKEIDEQTAGKKNLNKEQEIQNFLKEDLTSPVDFRTSEGLQCKSGKVNEQEASVESELSSLSWSCNAANFENFKVANNGVKNQRHIDSCKNDNADFDYVSIILHLSGFDGNGFLEKWHSEDLPLNPLLFGEVEACWPHEPEYSGDVIFAHHQLLFSLTNEVLLQIYESSVTYYPRELSFSCRIRPMPPMNSYFLEEVWERISRTLSTSQGVDQSVDGIVAQDLGKNDGWMNLQLESECVALELEDLILHKLLEEVICS